MDNEVEMKSQICLDLKKYSKAVVELSKGSDEQKKKSLNLVKTHKLFTLGLSIFKGQELVEVRKMLGENLIQKNDF